MSWFGDETTGEDDNMGEDDNASESSRERLTMLIRYSE